MKNIALGFALFLALVAGTAKSIAGEPATAGDGFEAFRKAILARDAAALVALYHSSLFQLAPRERLQQQMHDELQSETLPRVTGVELLSMPDKTPFSGGAFHVVSYRLDMQLPRPGDTTPQIDRLAAELLRRRLGEGAEVRVDLSADLFRIAKTEAVLLLKDGEKGWRVIPRKIFPVLARAGVLPKDLVNALKSFANP